MKARHILILACLGLLSQAGTKVTQEGHSSREDLASDVPYGTEKSSFVVRDNIYGVRVSNEGAPVVQFYGAEPLIVGFVQAGTPVELTALHVYGGINYWPIAYRDKQGETQTGWISGLFVTRQGSH